MTNEEMHLEILALEKQLAFYDEQFDLSIKNGEGMEHTRKVFHDLKKVMDRLTEIRRLCEPLNAQTPSAD